MAISKVSTTNTNTINKVTVTDADAISVITVGTQGLAGAQTLLGATTADESVGSGDAGSTIIYDHSNTRWLATTSSNASSLTTKLAGLTFTAGGATVTGVLDEDNLGTNSNTKLATQQSIKAYVDAQVTAQDLDFQGDSGGALSIDLDSEALTFTGGTGIDTSGSGNAVTFAIDSTVATLTGSQTLTNKTLTSPVFNTGVSGTAVLDEDDLSSNSATKLATQQSIKAYVDAQVTAQDLDATTDSGTIAIDLDSETLTVAGGEGIDTSATSNTITIAAEEATSSNKGVASFDSTDFTVSSGAVTVNAERVQDIVGAMFSSNTETGIAATYEDGDGTVDLVIGSGVITNAMLAGSIANAKLANSSITVSDGSNTTAIALGGTVTYAAGEGLDVAESSGTVTFSAEDATASNKGVASFTSDFSVSSGAVSLGTSGVTAASYGSSTAIPVVTIDAKGRVTSATTASLSTSFTLSADSGSNDTFSTGGTLTFTGGEGVDTTVSDDTITIAAELATETNAGVATFDGTDFTVSSGDVTINAERVQDIVGAMVGSNTESGISVTYEDGDGTLDFNVNDPTITIDGDIDGSATMTNLGNTTISLTLDTVNSNVGSFGSATAIPAITVNAKGLITAVSTNAIATNFTLAADSGSNDTFNTGETLTFSGTSNEITTTVSNNAITIALPDDVTIGNDLTVTGDLTVNGDTVTLNTSTLTVEDLTIRVGKGATTLANTDGAGIEFGASSGKPTITWDNGNSRLSSNKTFYAASLVGALTGNATTATALETARTIHGVSFDGSANIDLSEVISDTVGAMFSSNTETGITATYQDGDNTIDLVVGTLNQDTTGNAATATALETARTIHGVSFDGSANIDLSEVIADTVGAMFSSNTETGITVTYADGDNTIDLVVDTSALTETLTNKTLTSPVLNTGVSGTAIKDEDNMASDSATHLATQQSIKAYVDSTAQTTEEVQDIVGAMFSSNTETGITVTYEDGDGTIDLVVGTLNQDTTGNAATFTATANNSTDETVYPIFVDGATGTQGAETDTGFTYNPSTGVLTATGFTGNVTGNVTGDVTGNVSGTAATVTGAAQSNITSLGTLTSLTVDNMAFDGSTVTVSADYTVDSSGDIAFDADGGDIRFKDGGTEFYKVAKNGDHVQLFSVIQDGDLTFNGFDGSSHIVALTLDMSDAGNAIFNSGGEFHGSLHLDSDSAQLQLGDDNDMQVYHNGSHGTINVGTGNLTLDVAGDIALDADGGDIKFQDAGTDIFSIINSSSDVQLKAAVQDKDMQFRGNDGGSIITALTLDMSDAGTATFNHDVLLGSSGRIGIGIAPVEMLDIQSASGDARIRLDAPASSDTEIKFFNDGSAQYTIGHDDATDNFVIGGANVDAPFVSVDKSGEVGIGTSSPSVSLDISDTDAVKVPVGTTAQRPSGAAGLFRYNSTLSKFEGYTDSWGEIGGGGTSTFSVNTYTANGSTTAFTLSQAPDSEDNIIVFVEGVFMNPNDFTLSGTTLTLDAAPPNGRKIVVYHVTAAVAGTGVWQNSFTGNGSTTAFTLGVSADSENNTQVYIDGVYQNKSTYAVSGTTLTFDAAPASSAAIEVMTFTQTDINTFPASGISNLTAVTPVSGDYLMILDATDNALKKADVKDIMATAVSITSSADAVALTFDSSENATFAGDVTLADSKKVILGGGDDLRLYHDSNHSYIVNATGDLVLHNNADDKDIILKSDDGSGGATAYLTIDGSAGLTQFDKHTKHTDSVRADFGNSSDLQIYHDGSHSTIKEDGAGDLRIDGDGIYIRESDGTNQISAASGTATLYKDGTARLATSSSGVTVTGSIANSSGDFTLDVAGDIILDAGGQNWYFDDDGTRVLSISQVSSDVYIGSEVSDKDMFFRGNDGGSTITALTLDMSDAGAATFNSTVTATKLVSTNGVLELDDNGSHNGIINVPASITINIDSDDGATNESFSIAKDKTAINDTDVLFRVQEDGKVGIGETAPLAKLHIKLGDSGLSSLNAAGDHIFLENTGSNGTGITLASGNTANGSIIFGDEDSNYRGVLIYDHSADAMKFVTAGSERMRIDSEGDVGIGTTETRAKLTSYIGNVTGKGVLDDSGLHIANGTGTDAFGQITFGPAAQTNASSYIGELVVDTGGNTHGELLFGTRNVTTDTAPTERMRIKSTGETIIGATAIADTYTPLVVGTTSDALVVGRHSTSGSLGLWRTNTMEFKYYHNGQGYIMTFGSDGVIAGDFNDTSDLNLKENISSISDGTTVIKALRPVKFDWKASGKGNNQHGFIAQEVETVLPNAVTGNDYVENETGLPEDEPEQNGKNMNSNAVLAHAVKAIQELEARIKTLEDA